MRVTIYTADGGHVDVFDMPDDSAASLVEAFDHQQDDDNLVLVVTLDGNACSHIAARHITRIDLDNATT